MASGTDNTEIKAEFANVIFFKTYLDSHAEQSPRISIYRNGRQQCYIRVDYVATDANGNQVIVDDSQVRLIHYSNRTPIPHGTNWNTSDPWYSSFTYRGYTWDRNEMAEAQALQDDVDKVIADNIDLDRLMADLHTSKGRIRSLTSTSPRHEWNPEFFLGMVAESRRCAGPTREAYEFTDGVHVDAGDVRRPRESEEGGTEADDRAPCILEQNGREYRVQSTMFRLLTRATESLAIAAQLTSKNVTFRTNDPTVPDNNGTGNGHGQFNSQVIVSPVQVPIYPIEAFGDFIGQNPDYVLRDTYVWWGTVSGHKLRCCEQYIHLKINGVLKRLLRVTEPELLTQATIWNDKGDVGAEWSYSYIGQPGSSVLYHPYQLIGHFRSGTTGSYRFTSNNMISEMGGKIVVPKVGQVTIGQLMNNDHLQISDWNGVGVSVQTRNITVEDEFGNRHGLRVYLPNAEYRFNYVAIAKR